MGAASGFGCYADSAHAASAACAAVGGSSSAGVASCTGVASVGATGATLDLAFTSPGGVATVQQVVAFQDCEPLSVTDGIELGWLVGLCWLLVAGLRAMAFGKRAA